MRRYLENSPQAAARIVALTLVADGQIGDAEIELLDRLEAHGQLGLTRHELHEVMDGFCDDLLASGQRSGADVCPVDERSLAELMGQVQDPGLRLSVLRLCVQLAEVDGRVDDGEWIVLAAAVEHWGLQHEMLRASSPS